MQSKEQAAPGTQVISPIGYIHTELPEKFGVPRQSGIVGTLGGIIEFAPQYRNPDALRSLDGFSHIWLLWQFSGSASEDPDSWQATVRPPRLGGNRRVGVFASRSPFRPNHIGLSVVRLAGVINGPDEETPWDGPQGPGTYPYLRVLGVDMMDGTPIYDIKPYIPSSDCIEDAAPGFTKESFKGRINENMDVEIPEALRAKIPAGREQVLRRLLSVDPRPPYQADPDRIYGMNYAGVNIKFYVNGDKVFVTDIVQQDDGDDEQEG